MNETIEYYNKNAKEFYNQTAYVDFSAQQSAFAERLKEGARILDLGCGSGRDSKAFLKMGYAVDAVDASERMCELAGVNAGIKVQNMDFGALSVQGLYDGVWACASLLHAPLSELSGIFVQVEEALKAGGIFYASFKYGEFEGMRGGRYFTDLNESRLSKVLEGAPNFKVLDLWISSDAREGREEEKWMNVILKKKS